MAEVAVRMLNQDTAGVLARVKRGEEIDVSERGVIVARIVPAAPHPLADRIAAGTLRLPTAEGPIPRPRGPVRIDNEAGALLEELRDEERY
ncbi:type II toxin-antitoxin system prevent-host-death family antitoxin [Nocardia sp. NEAU-G5]|uniref:Type II toxin-antitoxin system prevent-host-death family antitoxin n=1 Tax=Nocardia albiluteola TaxID=2842303 RepID=A0ABS6AXJ0_9NOCA|nr:type II toxin-antitoxin system prevent-host-death family antitoxin [Nocardia albiluteola]MBU3061709.1 type II toxin-antitoxin system prevent-host-death family antitoxin [Nocardia albiluteola]